jgi:hypothetical protein
MFASASYVIWPAQRWSRQRAQLQDSADVAPNATDNDAPPNRWKHVGWSGTAAMPEAFSSIVNRDSAAHWTQR